MRYIALVRHSGFLIFLVVDPVPIFFTTMFFCAQRKSNERGIFSPLVTPQSVKNFTGMVIEIEK